MRSPPGDGWPTYALMASAYGRSQAENVALEQRLLRVIGANGDSVHYPVKGTLWRRMRSQASSDGSSARRMIGMSRAVVTQLGRMILGQEAANCFVR